MRASASGSTPDSRDGGRRRSRPVREQRRATRGPAGQHDDRCPVGRRAAARPPHENRTSTRTRHHDHKRSSHVPVPPEDHRQRPRARSRVRRRSLNPRARARPLPAAVAARRTSASTCWRAPAAAAAGRADLRRRVGAGHGRAPRGGLGRRAAPLAVTPDPHGVVYLAVQVALRDALVDVPVEEAGRSVRRDLGSTLSEAARRAGEPVGLDVREVVVKDVILPADLRSAYAELVSARTRGQAQLEAARGDGGTPVAGQRRQAARRAPGAGPPAPGPGPAARLVGAARPGLTESCA